MQWLVPARSEVGDLPSRTCVHRLETARVAGVDMSGCVRKWRCILFLEDVRCLDQRGVVCVWWEEIQLFRDGDLYATMVRHLRDK
jgi:hypothetical protein